MAHGLQQMAGTRRELSGILTRAVRSILRASARSVLKAARDNSGAAAVEFALVAMPFLMLVFLALQTALIFFFNEALQTATNQAARQILTGQAASVTQANFKNNVCASLPSMFNCDYLMVDVQSSTSFTTINTAPIVPTYDKVTGKPTNTLSYSQGNPGDVVIVRVL